MNRPTLFGSIPLLALIGCRPSTEAETTVPAARPAVPAAVVALTESIDPSADPCVDFYEYACGHASTHGLEGATGVQEGMFYRFDDDVWRWMRAEPQGEGPSTEIRRFLAACREAESDQGAALTDLLDQLDGIDGGESFLRQAAELQRHGVSSILALRQRPGTHGFFPLLSPWGSATPGESLDPHEPAHADYVDRVAARLERVGETDELAGRIVAFEARLRELWQSEYEPLPPAKFVEASAGWAPYVDALQLPSETPVVIGSDRYTSTLPGVASETPPEVLRGYLKLRLLEELAPDLPAARALPGDAAQSRSIHCGTRAYELLEWHLLEAYGSQQVGADVRAEATALLEEVRATIVDSTLHDADLSGPAREAMAAVQRTTKLRIGWADDPWGSIPAMDPSAHAANVLALRRLRFAQLVSADFDFHQGMLGGRPIRPANAWNDRTVHGVDLGLAMLQAPVFDPDRPRWMNIASLGMIVGHELYHSYNPDGMAALMAREGFAPDLAEDAIEFDRCMRDAYDEHRPALAEDIRKIDPGYEWWFDETAADLGGLQRAYGLFSAERDAGRVVVPEAHSADALFFVGYAQYFCDWSDGPAQEHSRARVNAAVAGTPQFAETFECRPDEPAGGIPHACGSW